MTADPSTASLPGPGPARAGRSGAFVALAVSLLLATPLAGQELRYTGSAGYTTGSYTLTERTSSFSILNGLGLHADHWSLSASIPVVIQNSGDVSLVGGMQVPTGAGRGSGGMGGGMGGGTTGGTSYDVVLGDPIARVSFIPYQGFGTLRNVELQAMAKAPVADTSTGVGTGQWDVGAGVSAGFGFGRTFLFADASVWSPGDMPGLELNPYASVAAGIGRPFNDRWSGLASVTISSPVLEGLDAPASAGAGLSYRLGEGRSLSMGASVGLTDTAPDLAVYVGWSVSP